jgi:RNA polymerase sigma factor (sigma-70 family)
MESDRELLRQYAEAGNQAAFAEVVRRHTDFVYSVALRLVAGDGALAQDVAQSVFTTLASKAARLAQRDNLLGWLHTTTRYAASAAVRGERRRRTHEQEASTMHNDSPTPEANWLQLQPLLDEAVGGLREQDREAVLLRFFHGKSHREVGAALGMNETLVRKRVDRALEKLRVHLSRRGVTLSTALLGAAITTHSVQAAPAGLSAIISKSAMSATVHASVAGVVSKGFLTMKTKSTMAITAIAILAIAPVTVTFRHIIMLDEQSTALAGQNAVLEKDLGQIKRDLESAKNGVTVVNAVNKTSGSGKYVPVSLDAIRAQDFGITEGNSFKLADQAAALLGLSAAEARQVQAVLDQLRTRVLAYEHANLKKMDLADLPLDMLISPFTKKVFGDNPANLSGYQIRAMSDDELSNLQQWYLDNMAKAVGQDRAQIILDKSMGKGSHNGNMGDELWLKPGFSRMIVFSDFVDTKGVARSSWMTGSGGSFNTRDPYPDDWADLLKDARASLRPIEPGMTPEMLAVQKNLRAIFGAGKIYLEVKGGTEVSYTQLITGDKVMLKPLASVAGESYGSLVIHNNDVSLSLVIPGKGKVTYEP